MHWVQKKGEWQGQGDTWKAFFLFCRISTNKCRTLKSSILHPTVKADLERTIIGNWSYQGVKLHEKHDIYIVKDRGVGKLQIREKLGNTWLGKAAIHQELRAWIPCWRTWHEHSALLLAFLVILHKLLNLTRFCFPVYKVGIIMLIF